MNHNHSHSHSHSHNHAEGLSNVGIAFILNFFFAIAEVVGGILFGSTAILSDAIHDLGDSLALGLSYVFEKVGKKETDNIYTYGYKRITVIGAIINIVILSVGTAFVFKEAVESFLNPGVVIAEGMFFMSVFGIVVNGISVLRMKGSKNILDKTVVMHLLEDLLGWIAVFIVSIVIYFTKFYLLDSMLSFVICAIIVRNIIINIISTYKIIMQAVPDEELYEEIREHLREVKGVKTIKALNMWSLDGEEHVVTSSIVISKEAAAEKVLEEIKQMLEHDGIKKSTVELVVSLTEDNTISKEEVNQ